MISRFRITFVTMLIHIITENVVHRTEGCLFYRRVMGNPWGSYDEGALPSYDGGQLIFKEQHNMSEV